MSGVDPAVRQMKPIITGRVKDLIPTARVNDAKHAGDAHTREVMQSMPEMYSREGEAEHAQDVFMRKV